MARRLDMSTARRREIVMGIALMLLGALVIGFTVGVMFPLAGAVP